MTDQTGPVLRGSHVTLEQRRVERLVQLQLQFTSFTLVFLLPPAHTQRYAHDVQKFQAR